MSLDSRRRTGNHFDALARHRTCPRIAPIARPKRTHDLASRAHPRRNDRPDHGRRLRAAPIAVTPSSPAVAGRASTPPVSTAPAPTPVPTPVAPTATPRATPSPSARPDHAARRGQRRRRRLPPAHRRGTGHGDAPGHAPGPGRQGVALVVRGTGDLAFDRLEIEVVTSDVAPVITAREIHDSELVDTMDLSGLRRRHRRRRWLPRDAQGVHRLGRVQAAAERQRPVPDPAVGRRRVGPADDHRQHGRVARRSRSSSAPGPTPTPSRGRRPDRSGRAETGRCLQGCWWAGAESNRHSRRRRFYRPLGSPPAQPTHDGGDEGTRTPDLRDANAVLSQLSYIPTGVHPADRVDRPGSVARDTPPTGRLRP